MTTPAMLIGWIHSLSREARCQSFSPGALEWIEPLPPVTGEENVVFE